MSIFYKRPLGLILCIMLSGFSVFALLSDALALCAIIFAVILCLISLFPKPFKGIIAKISCFSLLFSFLLSFFYFNYVFYPVQDTESEVTVIAKVEGVDKKNDNLSILDINVLEIDNKNVDYKFKMNLFGAHENIAIGTVISFETLIEEFESDGDFNFKTFYASRGFSATCSTSRINVVRVEDPHFLHRFSIVRKNIFERASNLSNSFAGSLFGALLLGEKDALDGQLLLDFQRLGISHILALSGMHVAILMGALDRLLYIIKIRKNIRIILGCIASFVFMMLTGFPLSVTRAGLMLIISSVLFLITGSKDSITSLFVAATVIFLFNPYAALDLGLWLSILATLGILSASDLINEKYSDEKGLKRVWRYTYTSILFSLFALCASTALSALSFNGTSVISIISTLIFSILTEAFVYLGIIVLLLGNLLPLGNLLITFSSFISVLASKISDMPMIFGSLEFLIVKIGFVLLFVLFMLFLMLNIKSKKKFVSVIALCYVLMSVLTVSLTEISKQDDKFTAVSDKSDRIIIRTDGNTLLFDASLHTRTEAYFSNSVLSDEKITELDYYMVANYSNYLSDSLDIVLRNTMVKNVLLPIPQNGDEEQIAIDCFKAINKYRTTPLFYYDDQITIVGEYEILVPYRAYCDNSFAFTFKNGDKIFSYLSSGILENTPFAEELLYVSEKIIFGDYGTAYTYEYVLDEFDNKLTEVVIFDSKISFDLNYIEHDPPNIIESKRKVILYD